MGKVKVFFEKHSAGIIFITDFIAFLFSSIDHKSINIGILRTVVYGLNCIQFELLFILFLVMAFITYRFVKYHLPRSTVFTRLTAVCCLAFVLIESSGFIWSYWQNRKIYFTQKMYMSDFQTIPIKKGTEAFNKGHYKEADIQFKEALALVDQSNYSATIREHLKYIEKYKEIAQYIYSTYQDSKGNNDNGEYGDSKTLTPEYFAALRYCAQLHDSILYKQAYRKAKGEIVECLRDYHKFYEACHTNNSSAYANYIKNNGWCYFEKSMFNDLQNNSYNYRKKNQLIDAVLSLSQDDHFEQLKSNWMIDDEIDTSSNSLYDPDRYNPDNF